MAYFRPISLLQDAQVEDSRLQVVCFGFFESLGPFPERSVRDLKVLQTLAADDNNERYAWQRYRPPSQWPQWPFGLFDERGITLLVRRLLSDRF